VTIRKIPGGTYNPKWRDLVAKGRARKRAARPKRDLLAVKQALANLKLRYCQEISFWNPHHTGKQGTWDGGLQWVDFVVRPRGKSAFVVILDDPLKRIKSYEKIAHQAKQDGLTDRGVPFLVVKRGMSSMEYQVMISFFLRKLK
jgi:hypothetical protein